MPECVAVCRQNYFIVRSCYRLGPGQGAAKYQFAVNSGASAEKAGRATAAFLYLYDQLFRKAPYEIWLPKWFNGLDLPEEALGSITDDGEIQYGPIREDGNIPA